MRDLREELLFWTKFLASKGLLAGSEGNLSVRTEEGFFITPSGRIKETLSKKELAFINWKGERVIGVPSSEWGLHYKIYLKVPQATAIVHTHPPYVLLLDRENFSFREFSHPEANLIMKKLSKAPYFPPGSIKLWDFASNLCVNNCLVILSRHGVLSWGKSLEEAVNLTLLLEKLCKMEYYALKEEK